MSTNGWEPNRIEQRAVDIVDAIDRINRYLDGSSLEAFLKDDALQDAVARRLDVIGIAIKAIEKLESDGNVPSNERLAERSPDVGWRQAAGMRNRLNKEYGSVHPRIVWDTVYDNLPALRVAIIAAYPLILSDQSETDDDQPGDGKLGRAPR